MKKVKQSTGSDQSKRKDSIQQIQLLILVYAANTFTRLHKNLVTTDYSRGRERKLSTIYPFVAFECITYLKKKKKDHILPNLKHAFFSDLISLKPRCFLKNH